MHIRIALSLPRDAQTVSLVRAVAMAALGRLGVDEECVDDIRLALSEACTNVIDHADTTDDYDVRLEVSDIECSISVIDNGRSLGTTALEVAMPDPFSARGRGLAIMMALADRVDFRSEPEDGTIIHLVKRLSLVPGAPLALLAGRPASG